MPGEEKREPKSIAAIIDAHLQRWLDNGLNSLPRKIEPEMADLNEPPDHEGWQKWYPIASTVLGTEIEYLENQLRYELPLSYKTFLKHKHFYELYISEARFSGHEIRNWRQHLIDMAFDGYPGEFLIDKGYIPFADWSDWGLLCFNANKECEDNEYPIVLWDHERWDHVEPFSENFHSLLLKLTDQPEKNSNS
jgi:SMI1-KNR4 cell-wall